MRTAIIENSVVINVIEADSNYVPDSGKTALVSNSANIGDIYSQGKFQKQFNFELWRSSKIAKLADACRAEIISGLLSSVLGSVHVYPTSQIDQANLIGEVTASMLNGVNGEPYRFWCADAAGVWARRDHSVEQIQQVGQQVRAMVKQKQDRYEQLVADVNALPSNATQTQLDAIVW